jgi:predicted metal-binding membrane protein
MAMKRGTGTRRAVPVRGRDPSRGPVGEAERSGGRAAALALPPKGGSLGAARGMDRQIPIAVVGGALPPLLGAAVGWWAVLAGRSVPMADLPSFVVFWTAMMAAMMLPSLAPVAALYLRAAIRQGPGSGVLFTAGYLSAWGLSAFPAYGLACLVTAATERWPAARTAVPVCAFALCALYQWSPWKDACLRQCRSPLALLLAYAADRGRLRDWRAGARHGGYCLGCCWALMLPLLAAKAMQPAAMALLAAVVLAEKYAPPGRALARAVGIGTLGLSVALLVWPLVDLR